MRSHGAIPLGAALLLAPTLLSAQQTQKVKIHARPALLAKATVSADSAEAIALTKVPNGTIAEGEARGRASPADLVVRREGARAARHHGG